jgi:cytochrome b
MNHRFPVWDLPTRVFHWAVVVLVVASWWSAEQDELSVHSWLGYAIIVLVGFRIVWGFVGSKHSRFSDFLRGPARVASYVMRKESAGSGHNPLGGWSVMALLGLLLLQSFSGLFNSDDVLFQGPFYYAAPTGFRDFMGTIHDQVFDLLVVFVSLHVLAVVISQLRKKRLVQAMLFGSAQGKVGEDAPVPPWRALIIVGVMVVLLWAAVSAAPQPQVFW